MRAFEVLRHWRGIIIGLSMAAAAGAAAPAAAPVPVPVPEGAATRSVYLDQTGTIRWSDSKQELGLFGANYCIMSGSDYRMAGLVSTDRKAMVDEDLAQFARMGWTALRLCSWGDWENADAQGNLIVNEHVDLMDYVIAKARERGIYILLTPIHTYDPAFADQMNRPSTNVGFSRYFSREEMGTNPKSIAAQVNYIKQLLNHVNRYTGAALKEEPAILFVEMINEPVHHPENLSGSIAYINALVDAVRATGCKKLTFFNVSQDFAIAPAIRKSKVDGVSFGWYPSGLVAGHTLRGNFLQAVDDYPDMRLPALQGRPRIVYEFDQADLLTGYLYPAMARTYRSVGAQLAAMFAYDMLQTAPFNLGWQTHYLNLVHTPRKAVSAVIAAEAMRRLPRFKSYGRYPEDSQFGDFRVSYEGDLSELNADDAFMNAGATAARPRNPAALKRIVGFESSGAVSYEGSGAYFLDKVRDGVWRLEVYPDEVLVEDPFEQPRPDKIVSRLLYRSWPMALRLPDLGSQFFVTPITVPSDPAAAGRLAANAQFLVEPGVWLLTRHQQVDRSTLPKTISRVGFDEYHVNARISYPDRILSLNPSEFLAGNPVTIRVRVADDKLPDQVKLWLRPAGMRGFRDAVPMQRSHGNDYTADLAAGLAPGLYEYAVSAVTGGHGSTFPGAEPRQPGEWPFSIHKPWTFRVAPPGTALRILDPKKDYGQLSFVRPGERFRQPFFELAPGEESDESALSLTLPDLGRETPERYAASLYIGDVIGARRKDASLADAVDVKLRTVGGSQKSIELLLIERDGTAWSTQAFARKSWSTIRVPLEALHMTRSIHIPSPFPGLWNYWRQPSALRGGTGDRIHVEDIERLELIVYPNSGAHAGDDAKGAAVESIGLEFPADQTPQR
jgi:hypothetical protein